MNLGGHAKNPFARYQPISLLVVSIKVQSLDRKVSLVVVYTCNGYYLENAT